MQSHNSGDLFLKTTNNRPEITLSISDGTTTKSTQIVYINGQTTGLDLGYDAGVFSGTNNNFDLFTHLVANSTGENFALQALPDSGFENMIIPVGVRAGGGTEVNFTVQAENLPAGINVYLEDRVANTFTQLNQENGMYTLTLNADTNGVGQFYLHTTTSSALSVNDNVLLSGVSMYKTTSSTLRIAGLQSGNASITLVNLMGKQVYKKAFIVNGVTDVVLPRLATGIYIVQLQTEKGKLNKKIIIE